MTETTSFILSKLFWAAIVPSHLLVILLLVSFFMKRGAISSFLQSFVAAVFLLCLVLPLGDWLLLPLEQCFSERQPYKEKADGYVVLGGGLDARISSARSTAAFNGSADRIMGLISILNRNPDTPVIYTGGSGSLFERSFDEAAYVKKYLTETVGIKTDYLLTESASRNTFENAINTVAAINAPNQNWVLVTSAFHLPRAYALFEKAGKGKQIMFHPMAYDYKTIGWLRFEPQFDFTGSVAKMDIAAKEYLGLVLNKILNKSDLLWPCHSPEPEHL
jgi:uncharacterized SAM-binding protein YcdF (DUF218 family)